MNDVLSRLAALPPDQREQLIASALSLSAQPWHPNPGSQTKAYYSPADIVGFGGETGGGKTHLIVGLATTSHERSLILRRTNKEGQHIADAIERVVGHRDGLNTSQGVWRLGTKIIEFGGCENPGDEHKYKGRGHDLIAFDEVVDFSRYQFEFLSQWNRPDSSNPNQRCRIIATFNPPARAVGMWVLDFWAAWLNPKHPNPAKDGEIRWYTTIDGEDQEVDGPGPHMVNNEPIMARSRTFIRGRLVENTYLKDYDRVRAAAPKELRQLYRVGSFESSLSDTPGQLIPSAWVRAAQDRWTKQPPIDIPMTAIGVDCSGGGNDPMVLAPRYDTYLSELVEIPGEKLSLERLGSQAAVSLLPTVEMMLS